MVFYSAENEKCHFWARWWLILQQRKIYMFELLNPAEIVSLMLSITVMIYALVNLRELNNYMSNLLLVSFACILVGLIFSIMEKFYLPDILNLIEHTLFAIAAFLLALGCRHKILSNIRNGRDLT